MSLGEVQLLCYKYDRKTETSIAVVMRGLDPVDRTNLNFAKARERPRLAPVLCRGEQGQALERGVAVGDTGRSGWHDIQPPLDPVEPVVVPIHPSRETGIVAAFDRGKVRNLYLERGHAFVEFPHVIAQRVQFAVKTAEEDQCNVGWVVAYGSLPCIVTLPAGRHGNQ